MYFPDGLKVLEPGLWVCKKKPSCLTLKKGDAEVTQSVIYEIAFFLQAQDIKVNSNNSATCFGSNLSQTKAGTGLRTPQSIF